MIDILKYGKLDRAVTKETIEVDYVLDMVTLTRDQLSDLLTETLSVGGREVVGIEYIVKSDYATDDGGVPIYLKKWFDSVNIIFDSGSFNKEE